jgi:acyl dehydratase
MATEGLIRNQLTDETVDLMRQRIGYPNPTLRAGIYGGAWNEVATADAVRRWSLCMGDENPLYIDSDYAATTRWGQVIAPPAFEKSMGIPRSKEVPEELKHTNKALRGIQLYYSGGENFYYKPIVDGVKLYRGKWVDKVEVKESEFAGKSAIVSNGISLWDKDDVVYSDGVEWFIHAERKKRDPSASKKAPDEPAKYSDEDMAEIEAAYDAEYVRGADTLYIEDVKVGDALPKMVRGPLTITDLINFHMGAGWLIYGLWPHRLAYENRKKLRGFYTKNEFGAYDAVQRVHWDRDLAREVGINNTYDIGALRQVMVSNYLSNLAGDDAWIYRIRYEFRSFNYMGDVTWINGTITDARVDPVLGPLIEVDVRGVNQRGKENIKCTATILVASRESGLCKLPASPPPPVHRSATSNPTR